MELGQIPAMKPCSGLSQVAFWGHDEGKWGYPNQISQDPGCSSSMLCLYIMVGRSTTPFMANFLSGDVTLVIHVGQKHMIFPGFAQEGVRKAQGCIDIDSHCLLFFLLFLSFFSFLLSISITRLLHLLHTKLLCTTTTLPTSNT